MSKQIKVKWSCRYTTNGKVVTRKITSLGLVVVETFDDSYSDLYAQRVTIKATVAKGLVFNAMSDGRNVCLHTYMSAVYADIETALRTSESSADRATLSAYADRFCEIRRELKAGNYTLN